MKLNLFFFKIVFLLFLTIFNLLIQNLYIIINKNLLNRLNKKMKISKEMINYYTILYDSARTGYTKPRFDKSEKNFPIKKKNGICICSIGKNENLYIREFLDYHLSLGIKKIIIYDNNDIDGENFENVIKDYIAKNLVELIDVRGLTSIQIPIYNYCYQNNKNLYDWIILLDLDEYIYIKNYKNINDYVYNRRFEKCELIFLNWRIYSDNDLIKYDDRKLNIRFNYPKEFFNQGKSIVRGGIDNLLIPSTHIAGINIHYFCNSNGKMIYPTNFVGNEVEKHTKAYIKHFYTKTVEEFCIKINKGNAHFNNKHPNYIKNIHYRIKHFFLWNKITNYKIKFLENCTGINLDIYRKKLIKS